MTQRILVAVDGSEAAQQAIDLAAKLAKQDGAVLHILHVVPHEPVPDGFHAWAQSEGIPEGEHESLYRARLGLGDTLTRKAAERARAAGVGQVETEVAEGRVAQTVVDAASALGADMLVIGSRGLGDAKALLLGSVSHKVLHLAPCTVIAVK